MNKINDKNDEKKVNHLIVWIAVGVISIQILLYGVFWAIMVWPSDDSYLSRNYRDDIVVELENTDLTLVIKEWYWGLGSGATIYYIDERGREKELTNKVGGGDDGFCPFANGEYEIIENGDGTITVKWYNGAVWREKIVELPK